MADLPQQPMVTPMVTARSHLCGAGHYLATEAGFAMLAT